MTETMTKWGREFARTEGGGWLEVGAKLPEGSTARRYFTHVALR
jgi:putative heme iron utilization protein